MLSNLPTPSPSVVLESDVVGFVFSPQHTPLAITPAPPSSVIFPPLTAVVAVMPVTEVVDSVGDFSFLQEFTMHIRIMKSVKKSSRLNYGNFKHTSLTSF